MAKVSYMVGVTLHIGDPAKNEYLRQTVEISDVDTETDVTEQLRQIHMTLHTVMQWADQQLWEKITETMKRGTL